MKQSKIAISVVLVMVMAITLQGCGSNNDKISVKTAVPRMGEIVAEYDISGALSPLETVEISAPFSGKVASVGVAVGDKVAKGQVLLNLDTSQLRIQLQQAEATYHNAQSQSHSVKEQASINLSNAKAALDRSKMLYGEGVISKTQLDTDQKNYDLASNQYEASQSDSVGSAEAGLNAIELQIENARVKSPIDGVVLNLNVSKGQMSSVAEPMVTVADVNGFKLAGMVPQERINHVSEGDRVYVTVDTIEDQVFPGVVSGVGPMSVSTGTYFPIEIKLEKNNDLAFGLSAHAVLKEKGTRNLLVPVGAVVEEDGDHYLFVIVNGTAKKVMVNTGIENDKEIEILNGLKGKEVIATTNAKNLFDQMPVRIVKD